MSGLFSAPTVPKVAASSKPPGITDPLVQNQANLDVLGAASAKGYGSTVLTSGQGVTSPPNAQRKQLLGG